MNRLRGKPSRLYHLSSDAARARADGLLEQFGLTEAAARSVADYSGGMRRRLDLATSLDRTSRRLPGADGADVRVPVRGAMAVPDGAYMDFLIPGMLAMTMLFGLEAMVVAVTTDAARGVTDRIRAMPVGVMPALAGRSAADMLNALVGLVVMVITGLVVGWRPERGLALTLAALGLLLWLRLAFTWVGIYLGLLLKTPESAVAVQVLVWPVGFLSSAFVSPDTMPGWLGATASWNPLSATATAIRELLGNPTWNDHAWAAEHALLLALLWPVVLTAIFLPLAVRQYRALAR